MPTTQSSFDPFAVEMTRAACAPIVIDTFRHAWQQLCEGHSGLIPEADIAPVDDLPTPPIAASDEAKSLEDEGRRALSQVVVIKLNGGLGTSMGLERAKSLLPVRGDLTFLDIICGQMLALEQAVGSTVPLLFMDSFSTEADTRLALRKCPEVRAADFLQNKILKVMEDGYGAPDVAQWGDLAWCPPGHGDLYTALAASGTLHRLLDDGVRWAFVSNADNLGATLDPAILGYVVRHQLPFLMEVAQRTHADRKGGHLACRKDDGRLLLREVAQCPKDDLATFQDTDRHRFFNTNSIWLDLRAVGDLLDRSGGIFKLPLIRNRKTMDPRDASSPAVIQLETAMGAAIELFDGAQALCVPRTRFAPVKLCSDLVVLWSDAYTLDDASHLVCVRKRPPLLALDERFYKKLDDCRRRFPHGAPSLRDCSSLTVEGDVTFGRDVIVRGDVRIRAEATGHIEDGACLEGERVLS